MLNIFDHVFPPKIAHGKRSLIRNHTMLALTCLVYEDINLQLREKAYVYATYARCLWSINKLSHSIIGLCLKVKCKKLF